MAHVEPPPVYSELSQLVDVPLIIFRSAPKRPWFLSPFLFRCEPRKFAITHILLTIAFCMLGIVFALSLNLFETRGDGLYLKPFMHDTLLFLCPTTLPFLVCALFGAYKRRPNFLYVPAVFWLMCFVLISISGVFLIGFTIALAYRDPSALAFLLWFPITGCFLPLLFTSHTARVYLRVRAEILEDQEERNMEKKRPLIL
ncbi:hypothetical protein PFISCL1PPCAC_11994 [Pristionchus fissidentatus]|uniref:G protein-coupled receptor n=1 Tax=Pristionchus fissidentatus TaxID=1538716 RepID=A0AAV5VRQ6_9BILA|nr:hypothetical protein PFISCL1PPCAC_11994 [Pristionchus fissidentatus]